jgi:hypothetical protein
MFDEITLASVASSIRSGQYNLLLGAGVSLDSSNGRGDPLPDTDTLRQDLCNLKGARLSSPLQRVYSTLAPSEVENYVVSRFVGCKSGPTLKQVSKFVWNRVFTFNIDDALESAYLVSSGPSPLQQAISFHFSDDYVEERDRSKLQIIHLHGWVGRKESGFVFSLSEYVRQIKSINPWMVVLTQFLPVQPFIIAGTSLNEVDLEYYLAHRSSVTSRKDRGPSILIEPYPDAVTESDCRKYGLELFKGTALEFFTYIDGSVPDRPSPSALIPVSGRTLLPVGTPRALVASFSSDFELVPTTVEPTESASRFLYGHPASWSDLAAHLDIGRHLTPLIVNEVEKRLKSSYFEDRILLLIEGTGTGKTTVAKRVAFDLSAKETRVITCSALSQLEPEITAKAIDLIAGPLLIIVDDFASQASPIAEILGKLTKKDVVILGVERSYRSRYVTQILSGTRYKPIVDLKLTQPEANQLVELYRRNGLVGSREASRGLEGFVREIASDPIAVASCRILNDFPDYA